ncbi:hypothetical protein [Schaalia sp. lx-100]|uniref:hypothetical protein n=1 Tax=Schaalia sp. lx-100 TaxID=2899081 RepID=UPI001E43B6BC|nr:hypothetical protein [Schaalia sp. lx-100]MCD4557185.1 hypothetical protein [Schaalia sp. lx-100]
MTPAKTVCRQLRNLQRWMPLLTDITSTLLAPRGAISASGAHVVRDLADIITPALDAPEEGPDGVRTYQGFYDWAKDWALSADLPPDGDPVYQLITRADVLHGTWDDWEAFTEDLERLHERIARLTGNAPRTIGPCIVAGCTENVTQQQTRSGASGPLECARGHSWTTIGCYRKDAARAITKPGISLTAAEIRDIYPDLSRERLKKWAQRGKITHNTQGYDLAEINALMQKVC